jgi:hypothetical protein
LGKEGEDSSGVKMARVLFLKEVERKNNGNQQGRRERGWEAEQFPK